jgi:nicotinamide-nucleotide adenylyltransferase
MKKQQTRKANKALFVGRFQPFHLGHLSVIKEILKKHDQVIIVIGSAEDNYSKENPFTAGERFEMIYNTLIDEGIDWKQFHIMPVRNIENYSIWTTHVDQYLPSGIVAVYSGSPIVQELYKQYGKYEVKSVKIKKKISATIVREKMKKGNKSWKKDVPKKVAEVIVKVKGEDRIKHLIV